MIGMTAVNVDPTPSSLSTCTRPPSSSASLRQSGRPRPVPCTRRCSGLSIWVNSWKITLVVFRSDADCRCPRPRTRPRPRRRAWRAVTRTSPRSVNLSAFEMKLRRICDTFASSVYSGRHALRLVEDERHRFVRPAAGAACRAARRTAVRRRTRSVGSTVFPASIFARSSRSFTSSPSASAALRMKATCRSCSAVRSPSVRSSSMRVSAWIEFTGVRNSWVMFERKRDLSSSARRRWSAFSSSSAYSATTPRLVSSSSRLSAPSSSCRRAQLVERAQQLLVLLLDLVERIAGRLVSRAPRSAARSRRGRERLPAAAAGG